MSGIRRVMSGLQAGTGCEKSRISRVSAGEEPKEAVEGLILYGVGRAGGSSHLDSDLFFVTLEKSSRE